MPAVLSKKGALIGGGPNGIMLSPDPIGFAGGDVNLYRYVGNNPVNFIDPLGLCEERDKRDEMEWWKKLEKGYYYGTGMGEEAVEWWAEHLMEAETWYEKAYYGLGGGFSSLWTPETWMGTTTTLITAYSLSGWAAQTGPTVTWRGGEVVIKKTGGKTITRFSPYGHKGGPWYRRLPHYHRRPGIGWHRPWQGF